MRKGKQKRCTINHNRYRRDVRILLAAVNKHHNKPQAMNELISFIATAYLFYTVAFMNNSIYIYFLLLSYSPCLILVCYYTAVDMYNSPKYKKKNTKS